jgi:hypothetical protein
MSDQKEINVTLEILKDRTFRLNGPANQHGQPQRLQFGVNNNCIQLSTQINGQWANIRFPIVEFQQFIIQGVSRAVNAKEEYRESVECTEGRGETKRVVGTVICGRDADGICFIAIENVSKQAIRYNFLPVNQYRALDGTGMPLSRSEVSRRNAIAWTVEMANIARLALRENFTESKFTPGGKSGFNKGGNGGGGWKGNNGGGNNSWQNNKPQNSAPTTDIVDFDSYIND